MSNFLNEANNVSRSISRAIFHVMNDHDLLQNPMFRWAASTSILKNTIVYMDSVYEDMVDFLEQNDGFTKHDEEVVSKLNEAMRHLRKASQANEAAMRGVGVKTNTVVASESEYNDDE